MLRLTTYILAIVFILINKNNAQLDPRICPSGPSAPVPDPQWRTIPERFEIMTELILEDGVMELSQAFSPTRDAVITSSTLGQIQFYWNYATNEAFTVRYAVVGGQQVPVCLRSVLGADSQTSVITPNSLDLKPSVLLGFDARNQRNPLWGLRYDHDGELRGIPTKVFKSCFYVNDIKATAAVTYYVSDVEKFQAYLPANESILLEIKVNVSNAQGRLESYRYNVFRYSPNPSRREERQALETPQGVYCLNRTATIPVPANIPERVSSNVETYLPTFNNSIISSHSLYDTEFQFTRFDAWYPDPDGGPRWRHVTEIHDFAVGLSYHYDNENHQCRVSNISLGFGNDAVASEDNPNLVQMGDPQHLFLMDDAEYQFTGEKRCRDRVWCHVWIAEKILPNNTVQHREWYWASSINGEPIPQWFPMKLVLKQSIGGVPVFSVEMSVFNFRRNPFTIFEIDYTLAECYRALGPSENYNLAVLSFKIANDKNYPVLQNINYLRLHIFETLIFTMFVRPTRISHLIVDKDGTDIIVTFTLLDKPPTTGPVENPLEESSLDRLIPRLSRIIDNEGLAFRARHDNKNVVLRARAESLNVNRRSSEIRDRKSGPRITGLWIGLIIVGILVGGIGGFILFAKLAKN